MIVSFLKEKKTFKMKQAPVFPPEPALFLKE